MNARTQITLDPQMQRRAQAKAAELGISFAEYVRRLLAQDLDQPKPKADISVVFDLGASDETTDIARDKDKMVGDAVWEEYLGDMGRKSRRSISRSIATGAGGTKHSKYCGDATDRGHRPSLGLGWETPGQGRRGEPKGGLSRDR
jgi:hypothetical protein